jgi:hypothetical protein
LLRIAWWNWPDEVLFARLADFRSEAIEQFCERYDLLITLREQQTSSAAS